MQPTEEQCSNILDQWCLPQKRERPHWFQQDCSDVYVRQGLARYMWCILPVAIMQLLWIV